MRQLVYQYLENTDESAYCDALVNDKQKWQEQMRGRKAGPGIVAQSYKNKTNVPFCLLQQFGLMPVGPNQRYAQRL